MAAERRANSLHIIVDRSDPLEDQLALGVLDMLVGLFRHRLVGVPKRAGCESSCQCGSYDRAISIVPVDVCPPPATEIDGRVPAKFILIV